MQNNKRKSALYDPGQTSQLNHDPLLGHDQASARMQVSDFFAGQRELFLGGWAARAFSSLQPADLLRHVHARGFSHPGAQGVSFTFYPFFGPFSYV